VGFGSEFALASHWSARAEADYVTFGNSAVTASDGSHLNVGTQVWEVKIGINYHWSNTDPVIAR
jgi:opacity protein-like surface antigen